MSAAPAAPDERTVRVFVSSTFRDMAAERDELVKAVFPGLRSLCEERGVLWSEVDLRWGVTDEQVAEGRVLPICLEEIERCRPYFVGLLGERYGWVPDEMTEELLARQPWLAEHAGRSVTELEIHHGVLGNPDMAGHAFFYLRDPAYVDGVETERRPEFEEVATDPEGEAAAAQRRARLGELKARIRRSGFPVRDYGGPEELGELVRADFTRLIDELYPPGSGRDPLAAETAQQEAFARSRAAVYVERPGYYEALDRFVADDDRAALAVTGESGHGKSALLASWALRHRQRHPGDLVLVHFIGSTRLSAEPDSMLRRLNHELARATGVELDEGATDTAALRRELARLLYAAGATTRVVLVLDALNQLIDRDGSHELAFLPPVLADGVRLVASTLPGPTEDALGRRGWLDDALRVEPLDEAERLELIERYLAHHTKALDPTRATRIAAHPNSSNPLYLRALLDELRVWGSHETLDARIGELLAADTVDELFATVLTRYEADYETIADGIVGQAMGLLWASRAGLAEAELLELLGGTSPDGEVEPLPRAAWAPLHHASSEMLNHRAGRIGLSHEYVRSAIAHRYLPTEASRRDRHRRLAAYFTARGPAPRSLEEAAWQLAQAGEWEQLAALLVDPEWFVELWAADAIEVRELWARIHANSPLRAEKAYQVPDEGTPASQNTNFLIEASNLLQHLGALTPAQAFLERLTALAAQSGDHDLLQRSLGNQAVIHQARGELDRAMELLVEQEQICREVENTAGLARALGNQASIHRARGKLDRAMALHQDEERLFRELDDPAGLQISLGNQGNIHQARGELDRALALHREKERISRELDNPASLQIALGNQALIHEARGELDRAMELLREKERICRQLDNPASLGASLGDQAVIHWARGELESAMALHHEEERISRDLRDPASLQRSLGNQALIHQVRGELDRAMELHREKERICRELDDAAGLQTSLGNQALIHQVRGELDRALALHQEEERICRELGDPAGLQISLGNQALIHQDRGELDRAMELHRERERICRELGDRASLQRSLGNQAVIHQVRGELDRAMELHREEERISRDLGDPSALAKSLANQARADRARGDDAGAQAKLQEALDTARAAGLSALTEELESVPAPTPER